MKFIVAGVGPGDPDLVTYGAVKAVRAADLVLSPRSREGKASVAESAVRAHIPDLVAAPVVFPMTRDANARDAALKARLEELRPRWRNARTVALPVIGDSTLYATGFYLYALWKELVPGLELELVPGIPAHSPAAAASARFLAMGSEILAVVPATAGESRIAAALAAADSAALYKPSVLGARLRAVVESVGPWSKALRVDRAGLPGQRVLSGDAALDPADEYLSILLLWRRS